MGHLGIDPDRPHSMARVNAIPGADEARLTFVIHQRQTMHHGG